MSKLGKVILGIGSTIIASTAGVAIKNATEVKTDAEVGHKQGFYEKYVKRPQDVFFASCAIVALSPILVGTAIAVRVKIGSPVLFKQERPGLNEDSFMLYKFRTMTNAINDQGELLSDEERLTAFGKILRSTSLDELPELINIIKGDMSIVGPRPLLVKYLAYYTSEQKKRHSVRPGLTGYAQVSGRNELDWDDKFVLDVKYVNNISFLGDMRIVFQTIGKVLKREGISPESSATMEDFVDYSIKKRRK